MISLTPISILIQAVAFSLVSLHPIHISVTEIEFDEKDKALEIMMRVFMDDLEQTLRNDLQQPDLDVLELQKKKALDQVVSTYVKKHFKIILEGKSQTLNFLGHEEEGDAFIFYIEVPKIKKFKTIQIQNTIITDTYDDQSNLVHVTVKGKVRSLRLTRNNPVDELTFDSK